jgi:hypothetical protein
VKVYVTGVCQQLVDSCLSVLCERSTLQLR